MNCFTLLALFIAFIACLFSNFNENVALSTLFFLACFILYTTIKEVYGDVDKIKEKNKANEKRENENEAKRKEQEERKRREAEEKREELEREWKEAEEKKEREEENRKKEKYKDYRYCILVLLAKVMKADEQTMDCELNRVNATICRYYKSAEEQKEALNTFKSVLNDQKFFNIFGALNANFDYAAKSELIMELLAVAYADDNLKYSEEKEILNIVSQLQISQEKYKSIYSIFMEKYKQGFYNVDEDKNVNEDEDRKQKYYNKQKERSSSENHNKTNNGSSSNADKQESRHISPEEKKACVILGVSPDVTDEEIKKAYRALAVKYHPDNAANLGEEAIRQATESMKQINMAWETVKSARGMK